MFDFEFTQSALTTWSAKHASAVPYIAAVVDEIRECVSVLNDSNERVRTKSLQRIS
jgi:hypothetical protein